MRKYIAAFLLLSTAVAAEAQKVTLTTLSDNAVRVTVSLSAESQPSKDAMPEPIEFRNAKGEVVLRQLSCEIKPSKVQDMDTYAVSATFDSPEGEFITGLGQFQDGYLNVRGLPRRLTQVNTQISMPVILSNRGYGIYWENKGLTEFNPCSQSVTMQREGEGKVMEVNVTSTEGGKTERRQEGNFEAEIDIAEEGDYAFLLDVGQTMARKHHLAIDGKVVIDMNNLWLPPTVSTIQHLTAGRHRLTSSLTSNDRPTLYYNKVLNQTTFSSPVAEELSYVVFTGTPDEIIGSYRALTGQSPMLPLWSFGYVHCRERFHSTDEILTTAKTFREKQLPMDVMVQDWQWWGKYGWNAMQFDEDNYPDPKLLVDSLHAMGSRLMLSVWSKIDPNSSVGKEAASKGYYIPGTSWIDFFNPAAARFYWDNFSSRLLKPYGIDCWWQDATEPENDDLLGRRINAGKQPGELFRNFYPNLVSQTVYEGSRRDAPDHRTLILTRSGFPGIQRYGSVLWSGDVGNDWQTLRHQLAGGLSLMAAGHPWWTYDAGGFFRPGGGQYTDKAFHERFLRWLQIATFLPMMRVHGYMTDTEFWRYGEDVEREAKRQLELRYSLLPYIYSASYQVTKGGTMMRPLVMDFPADKGALALDNKHTEYMFGPALLIAPILEPGVTTREVYLPETQGGWHDFDSRGGAIVKVRSGSIIPTAQPMQTTAAYDASTLTVTVYPGADGEFTLYEDEGTNYNYEQGACSLITFRWDNATRTLDIAPRQGTFPGMLRTRTFNVKLANGAEKTVKYKGKAVKVKLL